MIAINPLPEPGGNIAEDVASGLTSSPKALPPKLFYDACGSALFEEITTLPEYYLTRTERQLLEAYSAEIAASAGPVASVVELGAGTARKSRILLHALLAQRWPLLFIPVDISPSALHTGMVQIRKEMPTLKVRPVVADYASEFEKLGPLPGRRLVLYLGSSIGNLDPCQAGALLRYLRQYLKKGDLLLLGTDMIKSESVLLPAYDDARGVTARFNRNVLERINRELGGCFDLEQFRHVVCWNRHCSRIEMYLESTCNQQVEIRSLGLQVHFRTGERIHTENSYKFSMADVSGMLRTGGFELKQTWTDSRQWFALHLAQTGP